MLLFVLTSFRLPSCKFASSSSSSSFSRPLHVETWQVCAAATTLGKDHQLPCIALLLSSGGFEVSSRLRVREERVAREPHTHSHTHTHTHRGSLRGRERDRGKGREGEGGEGSSTTGHSIDDTRRSIDRPGE
uniref:Secreted protein n=1 Tax=Physcomitrium patens TaxID=3218 RepID=A0A7I4EPZ4_PHYPA